MHTAARARRRSRTHPPPKKSFWGHPSQTPLPLACEKISPFRVLATRPERGATEEAPPGEAETQGPTDVDRTAPPQRTKFFRNLSPARARNQSWKYTQSGNRCPAPS